jgi:hypothetical protein
LPVNWRRSALASSGRVIDEERAIRLPISLVHWMLRRLLELVVLRLRSEHSKEFETLVLRQQRQVLQRQVARLRLRTGGYCWPRSAACHGGPAWPSLFVEPAT